MDNLESHDVYKQDINQKLRLEAMKLIVSHGQASSIISVINAILLLIVFQELVETPVLYSWLAFVIGITILRAIMVSAFWRLEEQGRRFDRWFRGYLFLIYCSAACWGVLPLSVAFSAESWTETFIVFVITGMSAGGLVSFYALLSAAIPFCIIITVPLIYVFALGAGPHHWIMACLASLYLLILIRSALSLNTSIKKTIRLEMENVELFNFLSEAKKTSSELGAADTDTHDSLNIQQFSKSV